MQTNYCIQKIRNISCEIFTNRKNIYILHLKCNLYIKAMNSFKKYLELSDESLLDQCEITTFRSSGKGGQHVNKTESAVRLFHVPSEITVTSQKERSQYLNKITALEQLRRKLFDLSKEKKPRIPTKPSVKSKHERLKEKSIQSEKKMIRIKGFFNENE